MRSKHQTSRGWGRVLAAPEDVHRPERAAQLEKLVAKAPAPAVGNRRSYGDAALNSGGTTIDMTRLNRCLSFDPATGVAEVETGVTIGELLDISAPLGWMPAVLPGTGFATVGGCIANDVHGKNHHSAGSFGQHVLEMTLLTAKGLQTVSPDSDPDLFRATMGGVGQTGVIASAQLQLAPCPGELVQVEERRMDGIEEFLSCLAASRADYSVGWIDATAKGHDLGRGILEEGTVVPGSAPSRATPRTVPAVVPPLLVSAPVVRAFNAAYLRRVPEGGRSRHRGLAGFFFPLDRLHGWNRLYGKRGFHQFQCVLPEGAEDTLRDMLERIAASGLASPLAVLKRLGPGRAGMMSFPMAGMTLAVDFPNRRAAEALAIELEWLAVEAGGRIYLAKDALADPDLIARMYPDLPKFAATLSRVDPKGVFQTDLSRRLNLRGAS